jgi:hypothetical protein
VLYEPLEVLERSEFSWLLLVLSLSNLGLVHEDWSCCDFEADSCYADNFREFLWS